jgi:hypothetical protein
MDQAICLDYSGIGTLRNSTNLANWLIDHNERHPDLPSFPKPHPLDGRRRERTTAFFSIAAVGDDGIEVARILTMGVIWLVIFPSASRAGDVGDE